LLHGLLAAATTSPARVLAPITLDAATGRMLVQPPPLHRASRLCVRVHGAATSGSAGGTGASAGAAPTAAPTAALPAAVAVLDQAEVVLQPGASAGSDSSSALDDADAPRAQAVCQAVAAAAAAERLFHTLQLQALASLHCDVAARPHDADGGPDADTLLSRIAAALAGLPSAAGMAALRPTVVQPRCVLLEAAGGGQPVAPARWYEISLETAPGTSASATATATASAPAAAAAGSGEAAAVACALAASAGAFAGSGAGLADSSSDNEL
jgi:hypothetical protein